VKNSAEVLAELQKGNARFWMGTSAHPERTAFERRSLIMAQYPNAAVLGCADSRVPTEIVFDQGLGDIFTIRVAGNAVTGGAAAAPVQNAVHHLNVKVVVVMGHEGCGAVKAACLPLEKVCSSTSKYIKNDLSLQCANASITPHAD
jgi:carbonic anhydrase